MYAAGSFLLGAVELVVVCLAALVFETSPLEVLSLRVDATSPFVIAGYCLFAAGSVLMLLSRRKSARR
jgi:hypothetical protein